MSIVISKLCETEVFKILVSNNFKMHKYSIQIQLYKPLDRFEAVN